MSKQFVKPILSEDKYKVTKSELEEMGLDSSSDSVKINNVTYYPLNENEFSCLSPNEVCISEDHQLCLVIGEGKVSDQLQPILNTRFSKLIDLHYHNNNLLSERNLRLMLTYLGIGFNTRVYKNQTYIEYVASNGIGLKAQYTTLKIGTYPINFEGFEELDDILESLNESNEELDEYQPTKYDTLLELTDYGDVADYISLKTLVSTYQVEDLIIPEEPIDKIGLEIAHKGIFLTARLRYAPGDFDNQVYWIRPKKFIQTNRIVEKGDLIELVILYKHSENGRRPVTWTEGEDPDTTENILADISTSEEDQDPLIYYTKYEDTLCKINYIEETEEGKTSIPITWNGYHATFGNLQEFVRVIRFEVINGFVKFNDFILEITDDTICVFPIDRYISEYYIYSSKVIYKDKYKLPDYSQYTDEELIEMGAQIKWTLRLKTRDSNILDYHQSCTFTSELIKDYVISKITIRRYKYDVTNETTITASDNSHITIEGLTVTSNYMDYAHPLQIQIIPHYQNYKPTKFKLNLETTWEALLDAASHEYSLNLEGTIHGN